MKIFLKLLIGALLFYGTVYLACAYYYPNYLTIDLPFLVLLNQGQDSPVGILASAIVGVFAFLTIVFIEPQKPTMGFARWGDKKTRKRARLDSKSGVVMGELCKITLPKEVKVPNPEDMKVTNLGLKNMMDRPLSVAVIAPPGTGKTTAIVIPTLFEAKHSFIIHDPKGEIFDTTAPWRATFSKILRFDPMADGRTAVFNPFDKNTIPSEEHKIRGHIQNIAMKLIPDDKDGAFFVDNARKVFIFIAEWLIKKNGSTSLPEIADKIFSTPNVAEEFQNMIDFICQEYGQEEIDHELNTTKWVFEDKIAGVIYRDGNGALATASAEDAWGSILGTITPHLDKFANDLQIRRAMEGKSDINAMMFKDNPTSLYIVVRDEDRKKLFPIVNLMMEYLASRLISLQPKEWVQINEQRPPETKINRKEPILVTFLIDEFPRLGKMEEIFNLPAISRGAKVNVVYIAQSLGQISNTYGSENIKTFKDNIEYWYVFRQNSVESAKDVSDLIGHETTTKKSSSIDKKKLVNKETSQSISDEKNLLVSEEFIRALPSDPEIEKHTYAIVIRNGLAYRPMLVENLSWYEHKPYKRKFKENEAMLDFLKG